VEVREIAPPVSFQYHNGDDTPLDGNTELAFQWVFIPHCALISANENQSLISRSFLTCTGREGWVVVRESDCRARNSDYVAVDPFESVSVVPLLRVYCSCCLSTTREALHELIESALVCSSEKGRHWMTGTPCPSQSSGEMGAEIGSPCQHHCASSAAVRL